VPLDSAVRDLVASRTGTRPDGPIRLLTHLRYFGHCFNPVSFYYCFDAAGTRVETIVAEVNNTPWGEQHCYVLTEPAVGGERNLNFRSDKVFHVSPFMPMDLVYEWSFSVPDYRLNVHMALRPRSGGDKLFDATMQLARKPITGRSLAAILLRFPVMTLEIVAAIHWQALKLWLKRVPVHTHPAKLNAADSNTGVPATK
jgi:DUF1365 family protein